MQLEFTKGFQKDVKHLPKDAQEKIKYFLQALEEANNLEELSSVKQLKTNGKDDRLCYRLRIGDYRIGFILKKNTVKMMVAGHRGDIYHKFP